MAEARLSKPVSQMSQAEFLAAFGALYEHSPWVAQAVWADGLDADHDEPDTLHQAFRWAVMEAEEPRQLKMLRAHPQLAVREAPLTAASSDEQAGAGLLQCSAQELAEFKELNAAYFKRFGFPFIIAVKDLDRQAILAAFRRRMKASREEEFQVALEQVCRIGWHRLQAMLDG